MSYYILPKIETKFSIRPTLYNSMDNLQPHISQSLVKYMTESHSILEQQVDLEVNNSLTIKMMNQLIHTYDFLFCSVSGLNMSIGQPSAQYPVYYDIIEIYNTLKLYDGLPSDPIYVLCFGKSSSSVYDAIVSQRPDIHDQPLIFDRLKSSHHLLGYSCTNMYDPLSTLNIPSTASHGCRVIYFEGIEKDYTDINRYTLYVIRAILCIYSYQSESGYAIIKIDAVLYKPIIDLIYIISSMYEKIYIMKPNTSNIITDERYIICKSFKNMSTDMYNTILNVYYKLHKNKEDVIIESILANKIFYYFLNKLEESNVIIGQQKLDAYGQIINLLKSRNKMEKMDILQKHNIQKCMYWCEKYRVPYNKIGERSQLSIPCEENSTGDETVETTTDGLFYLYMERHYGIQSDSDDEHENGIDSGMINDNKIINYKRGYRD